MLLQKELAALEKVSAPSPTPKPEPAPAPTPLLLNLQMLKLIQRKHCTVGRSSIPLYLKHYLMVFIQTQTMVFAYVDKNEKIAAIVDKNNNYLLSKSFWNATKNAWQLRIRLGRRRCQKLGVDVVTYIKEYQDALFGSLNAKADAGLVALEQPMDAKADMKEQKYPVILDLENLEESLVKSW